MKNFAVIGCGNISQTYLYALKQNRNAKVVAVVDTNIEKTSKVAKEFKIQRCYDDYEEMLDLEGLDAVVICTPHHLHYKQVLYCAERGINILCEKPLTTTLRKTKQMINKCEHIKFGVMLQRRFFPNTEAVKKVLEKKLLGDIKYATLDFTCHKTPEFYNSWRGKKISGGGVLLSQALHRIDRLVYFFGKYEALYGCIEKTRDYIEVEDYANGVITFENGIDIGIIANNSSGNSNTKSIIKIEGTDGQIILSDDKTPTWDVNGVPKPPEANNPIPIKYRPLYYGPCHEMVINDFVNALEKDREPKISAKESLEAMKIVFGFYEVAKSD